jgi:hypothetical protein
MTVGSTQRLTEITIKNLRDGKERRERKADNSTANFEPIIYKMVSQPYGLPQPVTGIVTVKIFLLKIYSVNMLKFASIFTKLL